MRKLRAAALVVMASLAVVGLGLFLAAALLGVDSLASWGMILMILATPASIFMASIRDSDERGAEHDQ